MTCCVGTLDPRPPFPMIWGQVISFCGGFSPYTSKRQSFILKFSHVVIIETFFPLVLMLTCCCRTVLFLHADAPGVLSGYCFSCCIHTDMVLLGICFSCYVHTHMMSAGIVLSVVYTLTLCHQGIFLPVVYTLTLCHQGIFLPVVYTFTGWQQGIVWPVVYTVTRGHRWTVSPTA